MKTSQFLKTLAATLIAGGVFVLAGCGGGSSPPPVAPTTFTLAGTAASGAPFVGATVTVIDSTGATYPIAGAAAITTGTDGTYIIILPLTAKPPFVIQAVRDDKTLVSVASDATTSTINITPITNLIASRLSASGDPTKLAAELQSGTTTFDATKLSAKIAEVVALIAPLQSAVGDTTDPLKGKFVADGTGQDKLLDSLSITITPSSGTSVNIAIAVKQQQADNAAPVAITFTNTTAPAAPLPAITAASLVPSGTAPLIADFLTRATTCYALPLASRVNAGGVAAADIIAPECKTLFDGDNPANYKSNGNLVSSTGDFTGIFNSSATGVVFDRGNYEFTRSNGDLVISYRTTDASGNTLNQSLAVRSEGTPAKLKAIGNQYVYSGGVNAVHQYREFINQPAATFYSTGYNFNVNNTVDTAGKPIFDRVLVTSPKGTVFTLKPSTGNTYLVLVSGTTLTGTNFLRLRSVYVTPPASGSDPSAADSVGLFFASPPLSDADIAALPAQSLWQLDYFKAGNTGATPDATQFYKTRARAMTIAELQTQTLANFDAATITGLKNATVTNTTNGNKFIPVPTSGPITLTWVIPTGALAPTDITAFGFQVFLPNPPGPLVYWNETTLVKTTDRTGSIACKPATAADKHCSATTAGNYAPSTTAFNNAYNQVRLLANDAAGRVFIHHYNVYVVTIP